METSKVLFPRQIFDLATNFQRKFDNDHCNDVEKQSNFKKFDCLKADLSAFVETLSVSTFYNHYNEYTTLTANSQLFSIF
mgnify:CR=1 FL=1